MPTFEVVMFAVVSVTEIVADVSEVTTTLALVSAMTIVASAITS
jgi:hypothetical protein